MAAKRLRSIATLPSWAGRKQWALSKVERCELASARISDRAPGEWPVSQMRASRSPLGDGVTLERRKEIALAIYVTEVDKTLEHALREFLPDDLWNLLRALELAEHGVTLGRKSALREGEAEYRSHADQLVLAWRDCRRLRERLLAMAAARGLRGWDDPDGPRYRNSLPPESQHRGALMSIENTLLQHASHRVALWLSARTRVARVDRAKHRVAVRRAVVALLADAGLGYERIAALVTSRTWRIAPCPILGTLGRVRVARLLKEDLRAGRRVAPTRSAPVET